MNGAEAVTVTTKELAGMLGISTRAVQIRSIKEGWSCEIANARGDRKYQISKLPPDVQKVYVAKNGVSASLLPVLAPEAAKKLAEPAITQGSNLYNIDTAETWADACLDQGVLRDPRVAKCVKIVQDAQNIPKGWKKRAWIEHVARENELKSFQQVYRYLEIYREKGIAGFHHVKSTRKQPKSWSQEAVDFWIGLCLKKEHRKLSKDGKKQLYSYLQEEAQVRKWDIGGYESALWWFKKRGVPQLLTLQRGGMRALDNLLPPVVRSYADLAPFELLVGDQHRFDFWVVDELTGEVFRPEGYFWQDLRTRSFYGGALDKKYDSYLMGLALRMGLKVFGPFRQIYTDHGKPEESQYVMSILREMRTLGLEACRTIDAEIDCGDGETVNPCVLMPGTHRKAIVRNAKAKMIESTNRVLEGILRSVFRVPGYVKTLGGSQEENEVDQDEIRRLAEGGALLTFKEFFLTVLKAMDYYNAQKPHRGVLKEWAWKPKPATATPMDCLKACYLEGWRTTQLSEEAIDLVFLPRASRSVKRGRITFNNELYEDKREWSNKITHLVNLHDQRVEFRYDPMDPEWLLVFHNDEFICKAEPVEYSSMKDNALAARKIEQKARMRKGFLLEYRRLTSAVPDILSYSKVPSEERAAAIVGKDKAKQLKEQTDLTRERTADELAAEVEAIEAYTPRKPKPLHTNLTERYTWCINEIAEGRDLDDADAGFVKEHESSMDEDTRAYWDIYKESLGLKEAAL
jgi:putative transposase